MDKGDQGSVPSRAVLIRRRPLRPPKFVETIPLCVSRRVAYQNRRMTHEYEMRLRNSQLPSNRVTGNVRSSVEDALDYSPDNAALFTNHLDGLRASRRSAVRPRSRLWAVDGQTGSWFPRGDGQFRMIGR